MSQEPTKTLDAKGLLCPLPVLKARRAMKELAPGDVLRVLATDPGAVQDFAEFCKTTGDSLLQSSADGEVYEFLIRKAG
ncbi:MAG: sulfurtransferase TusA family protein [Alphaproteobacteria bacterium]|nr:sulfurtransferase TusA family protein [Alphaproteobacteria bacterium]